MSYILIIFLHGAYGEGYQPHYMGEYSTEENCKKVEMQLAQKGEAWNYDAIKKSLCIKK